MTGREYWVKLGKKYAYIGRCDENYHDGRGGTNRNYDIIPSRMNAYTLRIDRWNVEIGKIEDGGYIR